MSLYDRDYMREGKSGAIQTDRRPGTTARTDESDSNQLTRAEQVGLVIAVLAVVGMLVGVVIF